MASTTKIDFPGYPRHDDGGGTWQGRKPKGEKCHNSFAAFVAKVKVFKEGKAHLERHHNGYGL
jgi:hypothetical protein